MIIQLVLRPGHEQAFDGPVERKLEGTTEGERERRAASHPPSPRAESYELYRDEAAFGTREEQSHVRGFLSALARCTLLPGGSVAQGDGANTAVTCWAAGRRPSPRRTRPTSTQPHRPPTEPDPSVSPAAHRHRHTKERRGNPAQEGQHQRPGRDIHRRRLVRRDRCRPPAVPAPSQPRP